MHFWIDGYNFLFRLVSPEGNLKKDREEALEQLVLFVKNLEIDVTIVFDAQYQESESLRKHQGALEIVFTAYRETADDYLIRHFRILKNPKRHTLITNDGQLTWRARQSGVKTMNLREFFRWFKKDRTKKIPGKLLTKKVVYRPASVVSLEKKEIEEGSLEYYLQKFQTEEPSERPKSDYLRWLTAFEKKAQHDIEADEAE